MRSLLPGLVGVVLPFVAYTLAQPVTPVILSSTGEARALIALDAAFRDLELDVRLVGWHDGNGQVQSELPAGLTVRFPTHLPASRQPHLPVLIRSGGPHPGLASLTLVLRVVTAEHQDDVALALRFPQQAVFELEAADRAVVFPDRRTQLPVTVRNDGSGPGTAEFSFVGIDATAPDTIIPAGEERTIHVSLPPLSNEERVLTLSLTGGIRSIHHAILITSVDLTRRSGFGLMARIGVEGRSSLQPFGVSGDVTVSVEGQVSRTTYLSASLDGLNLDTAPEARFSIRYRGSTLAFGDESMVGPAGDVGKGFYLAHAFDRLPLLARLDLGFALPVDSAAGPARVGVGLSGHHLASELSMNLEGTDLVAQIQSNFAPFHASFQFTPSRATTWEARAEYAANPFALRMESKLAAEEIYFSVAPSLRHSLPWPGEMTYQVRAELSDWRFAGISVTASGRRGQLAVTMRPDASFLEADFHPTFGRLALRVGAGLPLRGPGTARLGVDASVPTGPAVFTVGGTVSTDGRLDLHAAASYTAHLPQGLLVADGSVALTEVLHGFGVTPELSVAYADFGGFRGEISATVPLRGDTQTSIEFGGSYGFFLPVSPHLSRALDGPDPTARRLRVQFDEGGSTRPLQGVRVFGCGPAGLTSADGTVTLRGPLGECTATIDMASLPPDTFLAIDTVVLEPGESQTLNVLATTTVTGNVRYRDPQSGEILTSGASRQARLVFNGPASRWATVSLPQGAFFFEDMPVGEYEAHVAGSDETYTFTVTGGGAELLLAIPGPKRTVLDQAEVTPSLQLELSSLLTEAGSQVSLRLASPAPIRSAEVELSGVLRRFEAPADPASDLTFDLPVPLDAAGVLPVQVTVTFANGAVGHRRLQLIVAPAAPKDAEAHGQSNPSMPGAGGAVSRQPTGWNPLDLVELAGSDATLGIWAPAAEVPPGAVVALYVTSPREIARIEVSSYRLSLVAANAEQGSPNVWRVLLVPSPGAWDALEIPLRVRFTDGSVIVRTLLLEIDRLAPVPTDWPYQSTYPDYQMEEE